MNKYEVENGFNERGESSKEEIRIRESLDALAPELKLLAMQIHNNPELSGHEFRACAWQTELLGKYNFSVETGICGLETAYRASYRGRKIGPKIAFLAEYDALPGLGHGCGHNLIAMVAVGCGLACREFVDIYGGQIDVIGTPAEETSGGKVTMAESGVFREYDAVMMAHPAFSNAEAINTMALDGYRVEFWGRAAHAAIAPYEGINALDAMINFYNLLNALRQQTKPDARIHGIITDGGQAANIIPDYTAAEIFIRANRDADVQELAKKVQKCADGAALGTGCTCKVSSCEMHVKDTRPNCVLNQLAVSCVEKYVGKPLKRMEAGFTFGSSDFGDVSYETPAVQLLFKVGDYPDPWGGLHTPEMVAASASEFGMNSGLDFAKGLALAAVEIIKQPAILGEIEAAFRQP